MATSTTTPRAGLPQWKAEDKIKFITDMSKAFADVDTKLALSGDAFIQCAASYDGVTKRHTLLPEQANIILPEAFTVRFIATASFTASDKVYIGGKEYTLAYTDGAEEVQTGTWVIGASVGITCIKTIAKAFVGAGFMSQFATKAPLASPVFTGAATLNGKEIPTIESGTFANLKLTNGNREREAVFESYSAEYIKVGGLVYVRIAFKLKSKGTLVGTEGIYLRGLPFPATEYSSLSVSWWTGAVLPNGFGGESSYTTINLYKPTSNGVANLIASDITDTFQVEDLSGCYKTNY